MKKITLLMLFALVLALPTWASDFSDDSTGTTIFYNITSDNEVEVTWGYNGRLSGTEEYVGEITIPETVVYSGVAYTVTAIGDYAFYACKSLSSITIPDSVTSIGVLAFEFCSALERVELGSGVTTIGDYAFYECYSLTSIDIPDSVTTIGIVAFGLCYSLESATIGSGAKEIGWGLFTDCYSLTKLEVSEANDAYCSIDNVIFTKDMITIVAYAPGLEAETYEIPETVTTIIRYAFGGACNLISIDIPDNVTTLEDGAFAECESLQSATIGNGIETIEGWAFAECYALSNVTLGSKVTTIEDYVFQYCYDLERMTSLNPEPPTCTRYTFYSVDTSATTLYVPKGSKDAYSSAEYWSNFGAIEELPGVGDKIFVDGFYYNVLSNNTVEVTWGGSRFNAGTPEYTGDITIPETTIYAGATYDVIAVGDDAFYFCYELTSIIIPASVTTIGGSSFDSCYALESATIGSNVTTIGGWAFANCESLAEITIPDNVVTIDKVAFGSCTALEKATLGSGLKTIGYNAFESCSSLTEITIPASVETIYEAAFIYDVSLTKLEVSEDNEYYCSVDNVLYTKDMTTLVAYAAGLEATSFDIPENVTTIEVYAFAGALHLTSIDVPDNVTTLGEGAFMRCYGLQTATIGNDVETINGSTFSDCTALTSVTLGSNVTTIESYVFDSCRALQTVISLNPTPPTCSSYAFQDRVDTDNAILYVPKGSKESYSSADVWRDFGAIEELAEVGDKIEVDGLCYNILSDTEAEVTYKTDDDGAISPYTQTSITIPSTITQGVTYNVVGVGYWAFYGCENMTSIDLGTITYIGEQAFRDCTSLSSIELPESLTEIGEYAFSGCSTLSGELTIPDNVVTIGGSAFTGCSGVTSVVIGSGVETIGDSAFQYCDNLTSVTFGENVVSIGGTAFASTALEGELVIPDKVTTIGEWAFSGCSHMNYLTLGSSLETIGGSAFSDCGGLLYVTSLNTTPPTCIENPFSYVYLSFLTLYVPIGTYDAYSTAAIWEDFWHIIEMTSFAISTLPATDVTYNSATLNGSLTPAYDDPIIEKGFEYWTNSDNPTTIVVESDDMVYTLADLTSSTTYTYRAYATMESGKEYGDEVEFTTLVDTGINGISSVIDMSNVEEIYTISGQNVNALQKGINIIRYSDGTTKKVLVK